VGAWNRTDRFKQVEIEQPPFWAVVIYVELLVIDVRLLRRGSFGY